MGLRGDERGQSEVIGALLIFAVIVAFIGLNQAVLVPQANEEIEFKHHNDVQREIVDLRAATTEAAASNQPRSRTVQLGTDYPSRFVAINPPPATGAIRTVDGQGEIKAHHRDLNLSTVCGTGSDPVDTKFIEYRPNYNEFGNALPMTVENTVAYREAGSSKLYSTGQVFAKGNQVNIIRYVGDVQESKSGSASLDLIPSATGTDTVNSSSDFNITLPTRVSASDWKDLMGTNKVAPEPASGERVNFSFDAHTEYMVRCTTVGINEEPDVNPLDLRSEDETANSINPNSDGEVVLVSTEDVSGGGESEATITLDDRTDTGLSITEARVNHYSSGSEANSADIPDSITLGGTDLPVGGEIKTLNTPVNLNPNTKTDVDLVYNGGNVDSEDFYVITLGYSNGDFNVYFISHAKSN